MTKQTDIGAIRAEYEMGQLDEGDVLPDAVAQFQKWFDEALDRQVMEPNAMALSTVSATGRPSSRIVLLKQLDESGFGFFTNYESQKGTELAGNPYAALLFFWPELQRQVRVSGRVEKMIDELSDRYFQSRPKGSKLGALASPQSRQITGRSVLDNRLAELEEQYQNVAYIPRPPHWGGYRLVPDLVEFWQGRGSRLHDRLVYEKQDGQWTIKRLAP
ncbi:pyridoxamine 5'-phosphate oxidase [Parapedobacter sp. ISTM3]|uniref:Pyridoxine/pyridoxamine 5'-phosphate oxidase n=1 Tax=Parapedobacter luteus TaxID=623280 RepID=A0A1T5ARI1_9SPHI|nr:MULTISPECIES: pyridoxamine 5'-phosphate oxidase [Parapedobacter]MBK1441993.1 pyridoxamine 5'-phosphate oxidase [Parapedobacter sp. ISTM3]SKB37582.1 Pyridoxamine 5'-phosphate oxidase [Parapedobacter luteus]